MFRKVTTRITTGELAARVADAGLAVVDVRPLRAYNGWRLAEEARGGHIAGAVSLPREWLGLVDDADLVELLRAKGLSPHDEVVLYGATDDDIRAVGDRLAGLDYASVRAYDGWLDWAADPSLPVERLPKYERLVHADWLQRLLDRAEPEAAPEHRFLLFHVNFGVPQEYAESHLPGALYLDTNLLENPVDWNRRTPQELEESLQGLGITANTTVVVYGRDTEGDPEEKWPGRRAGQIAACRAALILRYAGVDDVRLLDGGYDAWVRSGRGTETTLREPEPVRSFGASIPSRPDLIVDIDEAKQILADRDHAALVSVRTWAEHVGRASGYNYIASAGRIAGDVWGNCGTDAYHMQHYRNVDNTMRPYPEIAANWAEAGITADKRVAFYCGTGWRASETWFYAYLMGWDRIAVYDGGWFEWSRDPANPIEVGDVDDGAVPAAVPA